MGYVPWAFQPKVPCSTCTSTSYIEPMHGDCQYTLGKVFCSLHCRITYRWRKKWKYLAPDDTPVLQPAPSNE